RRRAAPGVGRRRRTARRRRRRAARAPRPLVPRRPRSHLVAAERADRARQRRRRRRPARARHARRLPQPPEPAPARARRVGGVQAGAHPGRMKHLLVTNDFPPTIGGSQSLLWEWWRRLPPDRFAVLTSPYRGAAEFDAAQPFRIERVPEPFLPPHPIMVRRVDELAREFGAELVVLDPAVPLGLIGPSLKLPYD